MIPVICSAPVLLACTCIYIWYDSFLWPESFFTVVFLLCFSFCLSVITCFTVCLSCLYVCVFLLLLIALRYLCVDWCVYCVCVCSHSYSPSPHPPPPPFFSFSFFARQRMRVAAWHPIRGRCQNLFALLSEPRSLCGWLVQYFQYNGLKRVRQPKMFILTTLPKISRFLQQARDTG